MDPASGSSVSMSLLARLQSRNEDEWRRLVVLFTPVVYRWARKAGLQDSDAADVAQEVFAAVHRQIDRFTKTEDSGTFRGWLYGITRNTVLLTFRKGGREPRAEGGSSALDRLHQTPEMELPEVDDPETQTILTHRGAELIRAEFEPRTWAAFEAVVVQGRPAADVAAEMGLSVGAVYVAKSRVLKRLREELEGLI